MPLDTGGLSDLDDPASAGGDPTRMDSYEPSIHAGADVGQALRTIREFRGLSVEDLAETTRVRANYITAIEAMRFEGLPSRPFVVGYIRAMAQALGADADAAADRFKAEEPVLDEPLPEPVGVQGEKDPRLGAIVAGAVVIIGAIVAWNVVQRMMTEAAPPPPTASASVMAKALANTTSGPVSLGAPLPAPVESTTPPPYITPGLDKAVNAEGQPLVSPQDAAPPPSPALDLAPTFRPRGQVYGTPASSPASVVVQALKPAFLVVRGSDGAVYFARQLSEGEAFRAPDLAGLTIDVSEPDAFQVFVAGQSKGVLPQPLTDVSKLAAGTAVTTPAKPGAPKPATAKVASSGAKPAAAKADTAKSETAKPALARAAPAKPKAAPAKAAAPSKADTPPF